MYSNPSQKQLKLINQRSVEVLNLGGEAENYELDFSKNFTSVKKNNNANKNISSKNILSLMNS